MPVGLSTTGLANPLLSTSLFSTVWVQLHTGDPGASGTSAVSAVTTRQQATFASPAGGALALASSPSAWNMTTGETITNISLWTASTAGTFLWSAALAVNKTVANGDTLTLNTCGLSFAPLAS
jgi:hypothetical protein